ncbi:hypothetical protein [Streptomyces sp. NRRL WC-3742]|uniref:hypothetical protein n=1 Tax=Streptomyces sp. NRRL WC-3742 TaxID=1463934 RepID=UPI0004CA0C71|nr:hypothetical protein [Streptomyces sp. NRRL WC-3742]
MFRRPGPPPHRVPTHRESADEWGERIAVLSSTPTGWFPLLGRMSNDDYLCHLDVNYHLEREFVAIVQTSRPVPEHHRVKSFTSPQSQLLTYLANSDRVSHSAIRDGFGAPLDTTTTRGVVRLDGTDIPVEVHHSHGASSALVPEIPGQHGCLIVTAADEHWAVATDLILRPPTAF